MPRYTDEAKEQVRDAVDFADLVGSYTELRRDGANRLKGLCPFHDERTPSFGINPTEKLFHCFGCQTGGDVFKFVELKEGLDFKGALEWLADRYGVQLEVADEDPAEAARRKARDRLLELLERTATFYARHLWESAEAEPARRYLAERGLEEGVLREFRVGYAPSRPDVVLLASRRAGFSNREVFEAGLASRSKSGPLYDRFRRRIMFPLCDRRGHVLGFGARAVSPDQQPKYLNSSDGPVYHKGLHLFGADVARAHAARAGEVVLAEGYTDVLALHQAGLRHAVGLMGTALTEQQVSELARLAPKVLLALDPDAAGEKAMLRAAQVAAGRHVDLRVVELPEGLDPADFVQQRGAAATRDAFEDSRPFVRFQVDRVLARHDLSAAEGKDAAIAELRPVFAGVPPSALREELLGLVADQTLLSAALVSSWLASGGEAPARRGGAPTQQPAQRAAGPAPAVAHAPPSGPALVERSFLAQCIALPTDGAERLLALDVDRVFSVPVHRRAARHLGRHAAAPADALPPDDPELEALIAELTLRAGGVVASRLALDAEALKLELAGIDRAIADARRAGAGGVGELTARRAVLLAEVDRAISAAMEEQQPSAP